MRIPRVWIGTQELSGRALLSTHLYPPFFATIASNTFRDLAEVMPRIWPPLRDQYVRTAPSRKHRAAKLQFNSSLDLTKMAGTHSLNSERIDSRARNGTG